jgi:DME family drug/metabolite transporter
VTNGDGSAAQAPGSLSRVRRAYLLLAGVCIFWGTIPLIVRTVHVEAAVIVAVRLWVASIGLGSVIVWQKRAARTVAPTLYSVHRRLCVVAAAILAVHWLALFAAYKRAAPGTVILIVYVAPVLVAAAAPRVLGETVTRRTVVAVALAMAGLALVTAPDVDRASGTGILLAVLAAVTFAALVLVSKPLAEAYGGLRTAFMEMSGAGLVLVPVAARTSWGHPTAAWAWLLVLGLAHTALGTAVYLAVLGRIPATHVGVLGYLEPAAVVLFGWLFLAESPSLFTVGGGCLIVVAGVLVLRSGSTGAVIPEVPVGAGS